MTTRQLDRNQWEQYFNQVSRHLEATQVDLEISGPDLGVQQETEDLLLLGLTYDRRDDAFSFFSEELEHRVMHPEQIAVREENGQLTAVEVIDGDENRHVARLRPTLRLPSSSQPGA